VVNKEGRPAGACGRFAQAVSGCAAWRQQTLGARAARHHALGQCCERRQPGRCQIGARATAAAGYAANACCSDVAAEPPPLVAAPAASSASAASRAGWRSHGGRHSGSNVTARRIDSLMPESFIGQGPRRRVQQAHRKLVDHGARHLRRQRRRGRRRQQTGTAPGAARRLAPPRDGPEREERRSRGRTRVCASRIAISQRSKSWALPSGLDTSHHDCLRRIMDGGAPQGPAQQRVPSRALQ
jgi:hypothetical protein